MIWIVFDYWHEGVCGKDGYSYRRIDRKSNPNIKVDNIENMSEDEQLALFHKIDLENERLHVIGGGGNSLLRQIFFAEHLDENEYLKLADTYKPMRAKHNEFYFDYAITFDARSEEDLRRFKAAQVAYDKIDDSLLEFMKNTVDKHKMQSEE